MPKILNQKLIFKSKLFNIKQADIEFNGTTMKYEIISGTGSGAVMVVPFIENDIIFIKEYAAAIDDYMITFPKGKIDKGETIEEAANRELQEEVGYKSKDIKLIKKLYLAPGYIDHMTYVMVAKELSVSSLSGDEPEELEVIRVHRDDVINFLDKNEIIDSRVHAALNIIENHE
jgi:ADP-ribose diphosphatase